MPGFKRKERKRNWRPEWRVESQPRKREHIYCSPLTPSFIQIAYYSTLTNGQLTLISLSSLSHYNCYMKSAPRHVILTWKQSVPVLHEGPYWCHFLVSHFLRYLGSGWVNIKICFCSFPIEILALNEALNYTRQMAAADKHSNKAKMACLLAA